MLRRHWPRLIIMLCLLATYGASSGCNTLKGDASDTANTPKPPPTDGIEHDPELGEAIWAGEKAATQAISEGIQAGVRKRHQASGQARRDAHPKAHGCVRANFHVNETLSPELVQGVFQPNADYPAWIRFSNGDSDPLRADGEGDARGMAIKLMNVPGDKLLGDEKSTQDFIMINHPVFFIDDPERYLQLVNSLESSNPLVKLSGATALGLNGSLIASKILAKKIANPLQTRFWSMVPYQLGTGPTRRVMKFSAKPCQTTANEPTAAQLRDPNYLRKSMQTSLDAGNGCFEFLVQTRDPRTVGVDALYTESSTTEWEESDTPPVKVATITIPKQKFDIPAQHTFCENLSYSPWHAVAEHRPLGGVNRVRRVVYQAIASLRRGLNHATVAEPTGTETF